MKDLKQKALRGGLARVCTQGAGFVVRTGSLMIMARLLDPKDFGLVGMVTAVIGVFSVLRDFGLSAAAIQRTTISKDQSSGLFWINIGVGTSLTLMVAATGPLVAAFYHDSRLIGVTAVLATGFFINAAGVQHSALLERQMRYTTLAAIDVCALIFSTSVGIVMAWAGFSYWALVATASANPLVYTIGVWWMTRWIPGRPRRQVGIRSMMHFGATLTMNSVVMYVANNLDKVLLGRFWGVEALGIYGRAYQLINIPTDNLNSTAGAVAFAALSRVKDEADRLRNYFLKGYSLVLSLTVPITFTCALFADDMIHVFLGPKWKSAAIVFRYLAPSALAFAILNPLGWLITALGMVSRGLKIALVFAPLMIAAYFMGLSHGPKGVALAISVVKLTAVLPLAAWAIRGTAITMRDLLVQISRPMISGSIAAVIAFEAEPFYSMNLAPLPRLTVGLAIFTLCYSVLLLYAFKQRRMYFDLVREMIRKRSPEESIEMPLMSS